MSTRVSFAAVAAILCVAAASARLEAQVNAAQTRAETAGRSLIGTPAPGFALETIDGDTLDLGRLYGTKAVYLKFWATWCVPCRRQMPHFEETHRAAGDDLAVIAVNTGINDSLEAIEAYRREVGITMPIVVDDGRLAAALNLQITPQHVVIGRDGRIDYVGFLADDRLDAALRAARESAPASEPRVAAIPARDTRPRSAATRVPDLTDIALDGRTVHARDDARATVFVFLSSWCESYLANQRPEMGVECRRVREQVTALSRSETRVRWLGVGIGVWATEDELRDYAAEHALTIPLLLDQTGLWFRSFDVASFPTIVIADSGGSIVRRVTGFDDNLAGEIANLF
jgi:thiol-disulfide isomerase/thioredoxin